ncbi:MAG: nucleotidyltransferase family protein [Candidatus Aminicenantes bacterium]|nr:nucleotidyltransferase family protein [Candidatus Aminicenantes bacterium]
MDIREKLEKSKPHLNKVFHVKEIGIFGSYVRSEDNQYSDIDILVEFEKGHKDFFNYMRLKYYLEGILQKKIDLVMKGAIKPMLKKSILTEVDYV